jgi:hypothetical protein
VSVKQVLEQVRRDQAGPRIAAVEEALPLRDLRTLDRVSIRDARRAACAIAQPGGDRGRLVARQRWKAERHPALGVLLKLSFDFVHGARTTERGVDVEVCAAWILGALNQETPQDRA